jgi:hypothetical protein
MKKLLLGICTALLVASVVAVIASCSRYDDESDFDVAPVEGGKSVRITEYLGSKWEVRIPPRIRNMPVTHIGKEAFQNEELTSVTIPNSVTHIEGSAFWGNQLTSVTIPNSVTYIGPGAFRGNQLTSVTIPNSVTTIENAAFSKNKLTNISIGNGVTKLYGFNDNQLTNVTIPNSVTKIGYEAFRNNQLTTITIPNSVTEIDDYTFTGNQLTSVTIPNSVTKIGRGAFVGKNKLTSVTIGDNLDIWESTFDDSDFYRFYLWEQDKKAGTYTFNNGSWSVQ